MSSLIVIAVAAAGRAAVAASTGTGFVVNAEGYVVTNHHVVTEDVRLRDGRVATRLCRRLAVKGDGYGGPAEIVGRDAVNDLAVLRMAGGGRRAAEARPPEIRPPRDGGSGDGGWRSLGRTLADRSDGEPAPLSLGERPAGDAAAPARASVGFAAARVRPGQTINLFGFPLGVRVSTQTKVTRGVVVATMGAGNNTSQIQIDAAANPGNGGGPVLDQSGNLVGILVSGIGNAQGFNFAIKSGIAENLLDTLGIAYRRIPSERRFSTEDLYARARGFVVLVICY